LTQHFKHKLFFEKKVENYYSSLSSGIKTEPIQTYFSKNQYYIIACCYLEKNEAQVYQVETTNNDLYKCIF